MIRNESEYQKAVRRVIDEKQRIETYKQTLANEELTSEQIQRALDPILSFHLQLCEEVESYERLKQGNLDELSNLHGLGRMLIGLRIALGLSQREFASRSGVSETQVSRDERNEYHGITVERATAILDALGVHMRSKFTALPAPPTPSSDENESEQAVA
jgi:DNA-directed RNA polymerase specialized sigma subunit